MVKPARNCICKMKTGVIRLLWLITITWSIIAHTTTRAHQPYHITPISEQAGVFYQNLGKLKLQVDSFNLLCLRNITFYINKLKLIENVNVKSKTICFSSDIENNNLYTHTFHCSDSITKFGYQIKTLQKKLDTIIHLVGHSLDNKRKRRGLINGVSTAFKWLFGTPDADDAEYYNEAIDALKNKNMETQILMQQQIRVMSSAIENYNNSVISLKVNEEKLNKNFEKFNEFSTKVTNKINEFSHIRLITEHINLLSQLILELNEEYDILISSILFAKQGIIHPDVISPRQLRDELFKIKLNNDINFPISLTNYDNVYKYFSICKLHVIYNNDILIFAIKVPITSDQTYNLYNMIPLPVFDISTYTYSFIDPSSPFLMISTTKTRFALLKDLSNCKILDDTTKLCEETTTYLTSQKPVCEVQLKITQLSTIPVDCITKTINAHLEAYHKLTENEWLFITTDSVSATLSCEPTSEVLLEFTLSKTGILKFIPNVNINQDDCCIKDREDLKKVTMEPIQLNNINLDELRHAKHKLEMFEETLQGEINKPFFGEHHTLWNLVISGSIIIVIAVGICCCCSKYCCSCKWIPIIGRFLPEKKVIHQLTSHSHNSSISNSNIFIHSPEEVLQQFRRDREPTELLPLNSSLPVTAITSTSTRVPAVRTTNPQDYKNPFVLKSRKSTSIKDN